MDYTEAVESLRKVIGRNVRTQRIKLKMTQEKLAEQTELSVSSITNIERGMTWMGDDVLLKISNALNVNPFQLFLDYFPVQENVFNHIRESIYKTIGKTYTDIISSLNFERPGEQNWNFDDDSIYKIATPKRL